MLSSLKYRKKELVSISVILLFALISTHYIYYKFKDSRNIDYNTSTLDVTFHEKSGDLINLTKVTPVTDSVGLSSTAYTFTIKNNTNKNLKYSVIKDDCGEYQIPHNIIKFSIHKEKEKSNIQVLSNLVNGEVLERVIKAGQKEEYTMRFWIANNTLPTGSKLHYHGKIVVTDEGTQVATTIS